MESDILIGEDITFGGNDLYIDLIPKNCWFTNVRYCIDPNDWNKLRKIVYKRVNYCCEICKINCVKNNLRIEAHERWYYDYENKIQKLIRIIALCNPCHQVTHYGYAKMTGNEEKAQNHLMQIRKFNLEECNEHIEIAYAIWMEKNEIEWILNLDLIKNNGFNIIKSITNPKERNIIAKDKIIKI